MLSFYKVKGTFIGGGGRRGRQDAGREGEAIEMHVVAVLALVEPTGKGAADGRLPVEGAAVASSAEAYPVCSPELSEIFAYPKVFHVCSICVSNCYILSCWYKMNIFDIFIFVQKYINCMKKQEKDMSPQKSIEQHVDENRFREVCDYLINRCVAKSYRELGFLLGYKSYASFWRIVKGVMPIPQKLLEKIKVLDSKVNVDWVLTGEGEMLHKRSETASQQEMRKVDRFVTFLYAENIQIQAALEQLKWGRRTYDKALREDLTMQQLADIEAAYPSLNMEWVLSGKGAMLKQEEVVSIRTIKKILTEMEALKAKVNRLEKYVKKQHGGK